MRMSVSRWIGTTALALCAAGAARAVEVRVEYAIDRAVWKKTARPDQELVFSTFSDAACSALVDTEVRTAADPALGAERRESLESAVLLLLERLSPAERAAYVLREAFEYPYEHIAAIIQSTEATTRQLVSRARKRLAAEQTRQGTGV